MSQKKCEIVYRPNPVGRSIVVLIGIGNQRCLKEGRALLKACAVDIVNFFGCPPNLYAERAEIAMNSVLRANDYLRTIVRERRSAPKQDLISSLISAEEKGDVLSEEEILSTCLMMVFAGFETTTNLVGNGLLALLQHPDELEKLRQDPSLMKNAVREMLRFEAPVQRLSRMALADIKLHGRTIKKGDLLFLMAASANRDPARFSEPDEFDISRDARKHLSFGHSIHICPGGTLAQLEVQMVCTELLNRHPTLTLLQDKPDWQRNLSVRSLNSLPIMFH
jgi:pimeloyl-[acyl-carrier protein] synthase